MTRMLGMAIAALLAVGIWLPGKIAVSRAAAPAGLAAAWGLDASGQLGIPPCCSPRPAPAPVSAPGVFSAIAAGERHSLAINAGTVWAWGSNDAGQLGIPTEGKMVQPVQVPALSEITAVAAGSAHSLALRHDGIVLAWGDNVDGDLGKGDQAPSDTPAPVFGLTGVRQIAAADDMSLALRRDGRVFTWGNNDNGQLGNGRRTPSALPGQVTGLPLISVIAASGDHVLALARNGTVWTWGAGAGTASSTRPVRVRGLPASGVNRVIALAAGDAHGLALTAAGTVWSWGNNRQGQLGSGSVAALSSTPRPVEGLPPVRGIAAAGNHSLAVDRRGTVWGWGANEQGQVGTGRRGLNGCHCVNLPAPVGRVSGAVRIAAGPYDSLALVAYIAVPHPAGPAAVCAGKQRAQQVPGALLGGNNLLNLAVSEVSHHLFVFNGESFDEATAQPRCVASVSVLDTRTGRLLRTARLGPGGALGAPGFALDETVQRLLVLDAGDLANDHAGTVSVFDTASGRLVTTTDAGRASTGVAVDAPTYRAVVPFFRGGSGIARLLAVTRGVALHDQPVNEPGGAVLVDERDGRVLLPGDRTVTVLDGRHGGVIATTPLPFGLYSGSAVLDGRLFVALSGAGRAGSASLDLVNTRTGGLVRSIPAGGAAQFGPVVADMPAGRVLLGERYGVGGAGSLSVRAVDGTVVARLPVHLGPSTVDPRSGVVYTISAPNVVSVLAPRPWRVVRRIVIGNGLSAIALSPSTARVYVIDRGAQVVRAFATTGAGSAR